MNALWSRRTRRTILPIFSLALVSACISWAQSTSAKPPATPAPSSSTGFAIESEMLTYTAMDSQAQAVACGIARNVGAADEKCSPRSASGPGTGIVVVASPSSAMSEFQLWRADISSMKILTQRASHYCPQNSRDRGATTSSSSLGSTILSMIPGGQALSFAQALFSSSSESNPVEGNIGDQALVADVAGHLRALGLSVVIPDTYMPHSLAAVDNAHSPYMSNIAALLKARDCLTATSAQKPSDHPASPDAENGAAMVQRDQQSESDKQAEADKQSIGHAIDAFLTSLAETHVSTPTPASSSGTTPPPAPVISHLSAVLRADGLAQELASASGESQSGENGTWYLLWLKALESGGTVAKTGNAILGNKTNFSGGAVGTYSLFRLSGNVVCSGIFYNYAGPMQMSQIAKLLKGTADAPPAGRTAGGCVASQ
jgi:hypothetical protein